MLDVPSLALTVTLYGLPVSPVVVMVPEMTPVVPLMLSLGGGR
jgi:hypothetical protein